MATKTSLLGLTKPAYTDAADITVLNTNFDLIDKAVGNGARVDNLIINGDFLNPVNYNGFTRTTGNGVKIIDMWVAESFDSGCVISLSSEGITLDCSAKIGGITYKFRNYNMLKGRTVTCAVCVNGAWECGSFKLGSNGVGLKINSLSVFSTGEHELLLRYNAPGMSITIQRVALYEGTYTSDTLPAYVVPDKRIEMFRCGVPLNPPNLLVNSWFVNPVNWRGSTEVSTDSDSYFIDRWVGYQGTFSLRNNGVQIQANRQYGALLQQLVQKLEDGVYTFAGKVDGSIVWRVVQISGNTVTTLDNNNAAYSNGAGYIYVQTQGDNVYNFHFRANAGYTIVVEWAALYEGSYTADTLPDYVAPDKRLEIIRCGVPLNPPNLLVNSWFVNPVNSQGAASYKGESNKNTYTIDRWFFSYDSAAELTVGSGYIQKNEHKFWQRPKSIDTSKMYTGAICLTNGTVYVYSGTFSDGFGAWDKTLWCGVTSGHAYFRIETGMTEPVKWAALYEGAYDAETLPEYVIPDKRTEMIRCDVPLNPPNLLDNSWFANPIAQAGKNGLHGVNKMPCDRWISWDKDATFGNGYMTVNSPYDQRLDLSVIDVSKMYTAAVCFADGTITCASGTFATGFGGYASVGFNCVANDNGIPYFRLWNNQAFSVRWAALYEGAYDADTLPEYHYKGYAAELAECQRYYIKIATQPVSGWCYNWGRVTVFVPLPVTMRVASPTVSVTSASRNFYIGSTAYAAEPTGSTAVSNGISVYFSHSHTGNGQCVMPEFSAEVSADL